MKGLVAVGLVAVGLLGGASLRPVAVDAQQSSFPFNPGDAVTIEYSDRSGFSHPCVIDRYCFTGRSSLASRRHCRWEFRAIRRKNRSCTT
jgi:hypothetical protein